MGNADLIGTLTETVKELSEPFSLKRLFHQHKDGTPLPSGAVLQEIVELLRAIIFPGYYGKSLVNINTMKFYIGVNIERLHRLLSEQIQAGLCFACSEDNEEVASQAEGLCGSAGEFSAQLQKIMNTGVKQCVFVIGGPYGFSKQVYQRANSTCSLSKMTFSHQMIRLIFTEQIYRACTILKGEPYHHE